jgi:hypothetical protein
MQALAEKLREIYSRDEPPEREAYLETLWAVLEVLGTEPEGTRPADPEWRPGGLVLLDRGLPTIVVPDLHARMDFFLSVLAYEAEKGRKAIELLAEGRLQIVCLGDGVHSEGRAARRWQTALDEFHEEYRVHDSMDEEMRESLGVMGMVMEVKRSFPGRFHFLKGNHENITNEMGGGNLPFRKYALEGLMTLDYMERFYGEEMVKAYALFEKELPLLAAGRGFLISHAEPGSFFDRKSLVAYRRHPEVVSGLTWTDNDEAQGGSVQRMLAHYLGEEEGARGYYFTGHRPVSGRYRLRAAGRLVQIHDPEKFMIAHLPVSSEIDPERDVREIDDRADAVG